MKRGHSIGSITVTVRYSMPTSFTITRKSSVRTDICIGYGGEVNVNDGATDLRVWAAAIAGFIKSGRVDGHRLVGLGFSSGTVAMYVPSPISMFCCLHYPQLPIHRIPQRSNALLWHDPDRPVYDGL